MTRGLTSNAREELTSKALDLAVWKRHKPVALEKVEDALAQQVHDDANVSAIIEAVPKVNAAIAVVLIVCLQGGQDTEFNTGGITVFLNRSNDLDGDRLVPSPLTGLDNLAKGALPKKTGNLVYNAISTKQQDGQAIGTYTSPSAQRQGRQCSGHRRRRLCGSCRDAAGETSLALRIPSCGGERTGGCALKSK